MKMQCWVRCLIVLAVVILPTTAMAGEIARVQVGGSQVDWEPVATYESLVLTVARPDGSTVRQEVAAGADVVFELAAGDPDGVYTWELRAAPRVSPEVRRELQKARRTGDATVQGRLRREGKLPADLVQSGSFSVLRGGIVPLDRQEPQGAAQAKDLGTFAEADQVIPDDLIVQGSGCFGFDCVNNESFGFDTIRLKENNLRIKFEDTSVGTFPSNDWQLTANDSASGGSNKFSIEDITGSRVPFTITAGATTNSIFVDSTGRVGFRTSTPVLDLHVNTSNTPALRLEQNNSGGFTAQTWDIGANEANFFVRDVTGGSRLSFRIRPGAPTSSLDISADGDVGVGTGSPDVRLDVKDNSSGRAVLRLQNQNADGFSGIEYLEDSTTTETVEAFTGFVHSSNEFRVNVVTSNPFVILTGNTERIRFPSPGGNVITAANGAFLSAGGAWTNGSSRSYKTDIVDLDASEAIETVKKLDPVKFQYKSEPGEEYVGFIAEDVPELVGMKDHNSLSPMDVVAVLTKVVQEQQKTIEKLSAKVDELEKANSKQEP